MRFESAAEATSLCLSRQLCCDRDSANVFRRKHKAMQRQIFAGIASSSSHNVRQMAGGIVIALRASRVDIGVFFQIRSSRDLRARARVRPQNHPNVYC